MVLQLYFTVFSAVALFAILVHIIRSFGHKKGIDMLPILVSVVVMMLAAPFLPGMTHNGVLLLTEVAGVSTILALTYLKRPLEFVALSLLALYGSIIYLAEFTPGYYAIGAFGVGMVVGVLYRDALGKRDHEGMKSSPKIEVRRDVLQFAIGLFLVALMLLTGVYRYLIFFAILALYATNSIIGASKSGSLYNRLSKFERRGAEYGRGAMRLAAGVALIIGFLPFKMALFGVASLVIGDALATIAGVSFYKSKRLPYNKYKSYAGTLTFFIISAAFGLFLLGPYGILLAGILAVVESSTIPIDDNISIPLVLILVQIVISLVL
jgi:dolichol kinase